MERWLGGQPRVPANEDQVNTDAGQALPVGRAGEPRLVPDSETRTIVVQTADSQTSWTASSNVPFVNVTRKGTGPGTLKVVAECRKLPSKRTLTGQVGIMARKGQFKLITVRLRT